jgi:hypothetical protein
MSRPSALKARIASSSTPPVRALPLIQTRSRSSTKRLCSVAGQS